MIRRNSAMRFTRCIIGMQLAILSATIIRADTATNIITRQNQTEIKCAISVDVHSNAATNWYSFRISVPKDDLRLKRLFRVEFVLGTGGMLRPPQLSIPVETTTNPKSGYKEITVGVGIDRIHDAFIQFDCFWEDEKRSSLDTIFLDLGSYVSGQK
jgi:hypothetical protein